MDFIVISAFFGVVVGAFVSAMWKAVDMLAGTATLTEQRFLGILMLCAALAPIVFGLAIVWSEWRDGSLFK